MTALEAGEAATAARPLRRLASLLAILALTALGIAGAYGAYCGVIIFDGNFHAVEPGVLYRSSQLSRGQLDHFAREYGIRSVLNLRGAHPGQSWYDGEMAAVHDVGIRHFDYAISAKRVVTRRQIAQLLALVRRAPKPLLIHCRSGADRAGLVAALFDYAIRGESAAQADRQLSLAYGHFPYLTSRSGAMDRSFWDFVHAPAALAGK